MGGILLPGQGGRPQGGGASGGSGGGSAGGGSGIELPKGFARRREETEAAQPSPQSGPESEAASAAEAAQTPATAEGQAAPGGRRNEFLFPPTGAQVQCPNCGTPFVVPIFQIIDLGVNPELLGALLSGQVNAANCPNCGAGGALNTPLLIHEPSHEFFGVYLPPTGFDDLQSQKLIGDLTQALMRRLPQEGRRGYMLQPKQYSDWQRLIEKLWEFQGVTPEMLRRQRQQTEVLQSFVRLANDRQALEIAIERSKDLIDRQFFGLLDRLMVMVAGQGDANAGQQMMELRNTLLETTEAGREIKVLQDKIRALLESIPPGASREEVLDILLNAMQGEGGAEIVPSAVMALGPGLDYQFLLALTNRLEQTTDDATRDSLEELRGLVMDLQDQQRQGVQAAAAQVQEILQAVLEAPDATEALRQYADAIDETFLGLLAANIDRAEKSKATAAVRRLHEIYDAALDIVQERMPPEMRLINQLVNTPDKGAVRKLLEENRAMLSRELIDMLRQLEDDFRARNGAEVADKLKAVRAQAQLMM